MGLSTHILDISIGRPVAGVSVTLWRRTHDGWQQLASAETDTDGRCKNLPGEEEVRDATYKLSFVTAKYFTDQGITPLHPVIEIIFAVRDPSQNYHIPLLLTANGYTTYRGS